ncbi:hypothetical protein E2F48_04545 [Arthrobacter crusticola]|uniref:Uncharacterized protein n=1 Tax=Arthrobacter crusticola TaxID=2547960 RepID=A0A4V6PLQ5_9MICC|nr:hypothetical protein [Arthrobacter crusticola]TDK26472.1 hypothetical protein E2F48_04545 [Arthrobacter crusticola]
MTDSNGTQEPTGDRRKNVLEPEAGTGATGGPGANIREQQGNSAGGMVPASFTGGPGSGDPAADRRPEDAAAADVDMWDSEG